MNDETFADSVDDTSDSETEEVLTDQTEVEEDSSESTEPEEVVDQGDDEESEDGDDQPEVGSEPDTVDVEYDGEQYKLPPRLKDALMRDQDYTAKTQSLAETRQEYEAEKADFTQFMEASKAQSDKMANLAAIDQQLDSFQNYDWNAAFDADITSATKLQHQMGQLQNRREHLVGEIQTSETERQRVQHENMVRVAQRTDAQMTKEVPNWNDEAKTKLGKFAVDMGLPAQMVSKAVTYPEINILRLAEIGYQTEQRAKTNTKAKPKLAAITPSAKLKPKRQSAPVKLSNVSDPSKYREMRMAQKRKQAKA